MVTTAGKLRRSARVMVMDWGGISEAEVLRFVRVKVYCVVPLVVAEEIEWAGLELILLPESVTVRLLLR